MFIEPSKCPHWVLPRRRSTYVWRCLESIGCPRVHYSVLFHTAGAQVLSPPFGKVPTPRQQACSCQKIAWTYYEPDKEKWWHFAAEPDTHTLKFPNGTRGSCYSTVRSSNARSLIERFDAAYWWELLSLISWRALTQTCYCCTHAFIS